MPKFRQIPIAEQKTRRKVVPPEIVEEYKAYVQQLEKGNIGILEFSKTENVDLARKALLEAGVELKKYVRVRRKRGENALQFQQVTRREWLAQYRRRRGRSNK